MNKELPVFLKPLAKADEKLYAIVDETLGLVHCEGALEPKYKHLMSMVADAMCHHTSGAVACMREAIEAGVQRVHLVDGRMPHSLLLEIFTKQGVGTEIKADE